MTSQKQALYGEVTIEQDRSPHSPPGPSALPNGKSELAIVVVVAEGVIRS